MDVGLLVIRGAVGALMAGHGAQKLLGRAGGGGLNRTGEMFDSIGLRPARAMAAIAGLGELLGGLLFAVGLLTPLAAALIIAVMGAAIVTVHWRSGLWNTQGGFEYNLVLMATAFAVAAIGPGAWSLDQALGVDADGVTWALLALAAGALGTAVALIAGRVQSHASAGPRPTGA
jgi:putative oxidoreductase